VLAAHRSLASRPLWNVGARRWGHNRERGNRDPGSGLTGAQAAVERRCDGGDERWWLDLSVRVKEGARELEREGKRGSEGWGCSSPFIGPGGRRRWPV
jgi:hypothetical protein